MLNLCGASGFLGLQSGFFAAQLGFGLEGLVAEGLGGGRGIGCRWRCC